MHFVSISNNSSLELLGLPYYKKCGLFPSLSGPWLPSLLHPSPNPQFLLLLVGLVVESAAPSIEYSTSERLQVQTAPDLGPRVAWILWTSCGISALDLDISVSILYAVYMYDNNTMYIYIYLIQIACYTQYSYKDTHQEMSTSYCHNSLDLDPHLPSQPLSFPLRRCYLARKQRKKLLCLSINMEFHAVNWCRFSLLLY